MKAVYCPYCGGRTKHNGNTSSGSQRWRCTAHDASTTLKCDDTAASTTGTRTRSGWINRWKRIFYRDTLFAL